MNGTNGTQRPNNVLRIYLLARVLSRENRRSRPPKPAQIKRVERIPKQRSQNDSCPVDREGRTLGVHGGGGTGRMPNGERMGEGAAGRSAPQRRNGVQRMPTADRGHGRNRTFSASSFVSWRPWPVFSFWRRSACRRTFSPLSLSKILLLKVFSLDPLLLFLFDYYIQLPS